MARAWVMVAALTVFAGCEATQPASRPAGDLERENRAQAERIVRIEDDLAASKARESRLTQELAAARKAPGTEGFHYEPAKLEFGFLTAAVNFDNAGEVIDRKFDNGIAAYLSVYDQFDTSLRVAGEFRLDLLDLSRDKDFVIATWTFSPEAAAKHWARFPGCYEFKLPLPDDLRSRKVLLKTAFRRPGKPDLTAMREITVSRP
jgi:hypothetical protein